MYVLSFEHLLWDEHLSSIHLEINLSHGDLSYFHLPLKPGVMELLGLMSLNHFSATTATWGIIVLSLSGKQEPPDSCSTLDQVLWALCRWFRGKLEETWISSLRYCERIHWNGYTITFQRQLVLLLCTKVVYALSFVRGQFYIAWTHLWSLQPHCGLCRGWWCCWTAWELSPPQCGGWALKANCLG